MYVEEHLLLKSAVGYLLRMDLLRMDLLKMDLLRMDLLRMAVAPSYHWCASLVFLSSLLISTTTRRGARVYGAISSARMTADNAFSTALHTRT